MRESPVCEPLFSMRDQMAAATIELGVFAFPAPAEEDVVLAQSAHVRHISAINRTNSWTGVR